MSALRNSRYLLRKRHQILDEMLRVDHSGELAADRIYFGQMMVLRSQNPEKAAVVQKLWDQEKEHFREFNYLLLKYRIRQSLLTPVWSAAGFILGFGSSLLGYETAMASTVAVEKVITDHYTEQIRELVADDIDANKDVISVISRMRDDEEEHHNTGLEHDAEKAPFFKLFSSVVENGSKTAIEVAKKV